MARRSLFQLDSLDTTALATLPFTIAGGFGAIVPHQKGYLMISLEAGNYLIVCPVVDLRASKQRFMEGMYTPSPSPDPCAAVRHVDTQIAF